MDLAERMRKISLDVPEQVRRRMPGRKKQAWYERAGETLGRSRTLAIVAGLVAVLGGVWEAQRRLSHG